MIFSEVNFMDEKEEKQEYAPRPAWQVWGARVGLVVFILFVIYQYLCILRGFR